MTWAGVAIAGGSAVLGAVQGNQQRKAEQRANQQSAAVSAAQAQYSPWTKMQPSTPQFKQSGASALGGAVQGGLGGAMFAMNMNKGKKDDEFKMDAEDSAFLNDQPKPLSPPMMNSAPGMDADGLEDSLIKQQEMEYFQKGMPKKKNAYGQMA